MTAIFKIILFVLFPAIFFCFLHFRHFISLCQKNQPVRMPTPRTGRKHHQRPFVFRIRLYGLIRTGIHHFPYKFLSLLFVRKLCRKIRPVCRYLAAGKNPAAVCAFRQINVKIPVALIMLFFLILQTEEAELRKRLLSSLAYKTNVYVFSFCQPEMHLQGLNRIINS